MGVKVEDELSLGKHVYITARLIRADIDRHLQSSAVA